MTCTRLRAPGRRYVLVDDHREVVPLTTGGKHRVSTAESGTPVCFTLNSIVPSAGHARKAAVLGLGGEPQFASRCDDNVIAPRARVARPFAGQDDIAGDKDALALTLAAGVRDGRRERRRCADSRSICRRFLRERWGREKESADRTIRISQLHDRKSPCD